MDKCYCDLCSGQIFKDEDKVMISVIDNTNGRHIFGKDLHGDCFNRLFQTDCNLIFNSFKK